MLYHGLAEFLELLDRHEELSRVKVEVDSDLEITEITDRVRRSSNRALLFERVRGRTMPVVTNLLGSERRVCLALGVNSLAEVAQRLVDMWCPTRPAGWLEKLKTATGQGARHVCPRRAKTAVCQQVVRLASDVDLRQFSLARAWPLDARPVIASGQLVSRDPETRVRRVACAGLEVLDAARLLVQWDPAADGPRHLEAHARRGERMPVAIVIGPDPLASLVSAAGFAAGSDTFALAGLLRAQPIEIAKCRTHDLDVPVAAEIVIEGFIDPHAPAQQGGGFAVETGYYLRPTAVQVCEVTAITHRVNPINVTSIAGTPPHEGTVVRRSAAADVAGRADVRARIGRDRVSRFGSARHVAFVAVRKRRGSGAASRGGHLGHGPFWMPRSSWWSLMQTST